MPDKLTDSEIVKALECASCIDVVRNDVLDLINRLQAENERLRIENGLLITEQEFHKKGISVTSLKLKAEAYKEFAERLKENACEDYEIYEKCAKNMLSFDYQQGYADYNDRLIWYIDNLLKEMDGDTNA